MVERSVRLSTLTEREPRVRKDAERARKELGKVRKRLAELKE